MASDTAIVEAAQIQADATVQAAASQAGAAFNAAETNAKTDVQVENIRKDTSIQVAHINAEAQTAVAQIGTGNQTAVAQIEANARVHAAQIGATAQTQSATTGANAQTQSATTGANAQIASASTTAGAHVSAAKLSADATTGAAQTDAQSRVSAAQIQAAAQLQSSQIDADARNSTANTQATAERYSADQQLAGITLHEQAENGRLNTKLVYAEAKFNTVFPFVQQSLGQAQAGAAGTPQTPGLNLNPPFVSTRGVFTPSEVQAQVNLAYARNDSRTQSLIRQAQGDLAGRGFSSNSPLLDALKLGLNGLNLKANNEAATAIRFQAAQANADRQSKGQELANQQFVGVQTLVLDSERNAVTRQVGLVSAIAQMVGGLV
jgi:hypothetical protein